MEKSIQKARVRMAARTGQPATSTSAASDRAAPSGERPRDSGSRRIRNATPLSTRNTATPKAR